MNPHPPDPEQWKRLLRAWPRLRHWQRKSLIIHAHYSLITAYGSRPRYHYWSFPFPITFALRATFAIFTLLLILPRHPISMPTAAGGGLAFALLTN